MRRRHGRLDNAEDWNDARVVVAELRRRIEWRVGPAIAHFPADERAALIDRMAWIAFKYDGAEALDGMPEPPDPPDPPDLR